MAIRHYKPVTNGRRGMSTLVNEEITTKTPTKGLLGKVKKTGGRNNQGKMTVRHIGGGAKRKYRVIDFKRNKIGVTGKVATIEYDPNRTANIALINYKDGEKRYIIAPKDLKVGAIIENGENADIKVGNALPLKNIPVGTLVHCIELKPGKGAEICRSAGASAQILGREDKYVLLRLQSGETRKVLDRCMATIGVVGNEDANLVNIGKAGRTIKQCSLWKIPKTNVEDRIKILKKLCKVIFSKKFMLKLLKNIIEFFIILALWEAFLYLIFFVH